MHLSVEKKGAGFGAGYKDLGRTECWVWRLNAGCGDWRRYREQRTWERD